MRSRSVISFADLDRGQVEVVGGKCANLGELTRAGFPVPAGFAVTTGAHERGDAAAAIAEAYARLGEDVGRADPPVAVRSSAVAEDTDEASFAGVQDTYLWLTGADAVVDGVRRCRASYWNPEAVAYRETHRVAAGAMAVAVQHMVDARVAGVMFTLNPVSGDPSSIAIDASWGLGTAVVGGEVTPDSFLYSKVERRIVRTTIGTKEIECVPDPEGGGTLMREVEPERRAQPCLEPGEVAALAELGRRAEQHYARPQDLEWAIDRRDELHLLQARPETVWTRKQTRAGQDAITAIAAALSGGAAQTLPPRRPN